MGLYGALWEAGEDLGVSDFGSYALDSMRIEKGYHGWQTEFGVEYTPYDAGLDRFVHLDKGEFIGCAVALEASERPPEWSYGIWTVDIGPLPGELGDAAPSATIRIDGRPAGYVTSAGTGFRTGSRVCLGYVEGRFAAADTGFTIDVFGTPCPATRHRQAVYDPDHHRPRS